MAPKKRKRKISAKASLRLFIAKTLKFGKDVDVEVHTSGKNRISGIAFEQHEKPASTGESWGRTDPGTAEVILYAEDFLLTYGIKPAYHGTSWERNPHQNAKKLLQWALKRAVEK